MNGGMFGNKCCDGLRFFILYKVLLLFSKFSHPGLIGGLEQIEELHEFESLNE